MAVAFWELDHPVDRSAVVSETGRHITYGELRDASDQFSASLQQFNKKTLGFLLCKNSPECLTAYLGALRAGHAVCLLEAGLPHDLLVSLLESYLPDWVFASEELDIPDFAPCSQPSGRLYRRAKQHRETPLAAELALLLTTSGSTGTAKLVRLSFDNLQANAESIVDYLGITPEDRALTSLPMSYSYGLSVLNTHLLAGGALLMTACSLVQKEYWNFVAKQRPTSLAGVPYHYELMLRLGLLRNKLSCLRTLTQAGGRLDPERISQVEKIGSRRGCKFFVMYGQTEATARIAYVPPERLDEKIGSVGVPIPGGAIDLDPETGELLYSGRNVMLGYASKAADLAKGDELKGHLRTGDLARRDNDGYHYIIGRLKRFLKVYGRRISLDEIETLIAGRKGGSVACFGEDDNVRIAVEASESEQIATSVLKDLLKIHPASFRVLRLHAIPRLPNGKIDYQILNQQGDRRC